ncbi:MAG: MBOAT family O-acyltransferase [Anaerolineae bacterium]|nr:hypothetical protein [Thermoflexales bacterium]MDW8406398.1 MBOAT family O-acyltransferase [Anaerolineae bacterium]
MSLIQILVFTASASVFGTLALAVARSGLERWRNAVRAARPWLMLAAGVIALYWLQPSTPIRHLDFWLPTATLALVGLIWTVTSRPRPIDIPTTLVTASVVAGLVLLIGATRYIDALCCLTPSRPPEATAILVVVLAIVALCAGFGQFLAGARQLNAALLVMVLGVFVVLKTEPLGAGLSALLRSLSGQSVAQASAFDVSWLGFSYIAFRLIHVLRDHAAGRLPALSLREFVIYVLFFPALVAGPIDRAERFVKDVRTWDAAPEQIDARAEDVSAGLQRIFIGLFKKFALADTLALIALNPTNAGQVQTAGWAWVLVYAYAFRLYLDFSGYTDIAVGMGRLFGVRLPENFDRPYLRPNLTLFWNSWHMTLANWFRAYWFNPLTRWLRTRSIGRDASRVILIGQTSTMLLIGLWHGVAWNFALWGVWHALGLFIHNRWSAWMRARSANADLPSTPTSVWRTRAVAAFNIALTFHFVALGWVWFVLPDVGQALDLFATLFGG